MPTTTQRRSSPCPPVSAALVSILALFLVSWGLGCASDQAPEKAEEQIGELHPGAGLELNKFTEQDELELFGEARNYINPHKSKIHRLKLNESVRFLNDLRDAEEVASMNVSPDSIEISFTSLEARKQFVRRIKIRSHRFGASFTNRLFSEQAILVGLARQQRIPFMRRVVSVEKDGLDVVVRTTSIADKMEVFDSIAYSLNVPLNPRNMVNNAEIEQRLGKFRRADGATQEMFLNEAGRWTTREAELLRALARGETLIKPQSGTASRKSAVDLDALRDPAGAHHCSEGALIHTSLDYQLYPHNQADGPTKIGTGGCFSIGVSATVEMNDSDYFKAYVSGSEKLWLDLIFASDQNATPIHETKQLISGTIPLYSALLFGTSISYGVDLTASANVDGQLSVVGGFDQSWDLKRGFEVNHGVFRKIVDKDDHFQFHPLDISGPTDLYGEVALEPHFGITVDALVLFRATGGINLRPYVYGELDFQGEVNAGDADLGDFTYETCYDAGIGLDWNYFITGLFGAINHTSPNYKIIGRKSFLRGGGKQCFPSDANGNPTSLTEAQMGEVSDDFNNCLDWSEDWDDHGSQHGVLLCYLTGDAHYSAMRSLGPEFEAPEWTPGAVYDERYNAWDIGGSIATGASEVAWAAGLTELMISNDFDATDYGALYHAATDFDLYDKHAPTESGGVIQSLIDAQCVEKDNKHIWTNYKAQLCSHLWDWYDEGYYGPDISLITSTIDEVVGQHIYDETIEDWVLTPDVVVQSYETTHVAYGDDGGLLNTQDWSPQYCFDWHRVVMQSSASEDMEYFLRKCKFSIIDAPEADPNRTVGPNMRALYEKISEAYCEHLECPYGSTGRELCPNQLYQTDGTEQSTRLKPTLSWNQQTGSWDEVPIADETCKELHVPDVNMDCGVLPGDLAHCNDDCSTVPYCKPEDIGTVYCTEEYWQALRLRCNKTPRPWIPEIKASLEQVGVQMLTPLNYGSWFEPNNIATTQNRIAQYFEGMPGYQVSDYRVETPGKIQSKYVPPTRR